MGKNWRGKKGGGGGGGSGGGGGGGGDLSSCRGYPMVIGTCDAARERETSKELVNLFSEFIQNEFNTTDNVTPSAASEASSSLSIQDMLAQELNEVRNKKHGATQAVISIQSGIKGIVVIKIMNASINPVVLIKKIFDKVKREKVALTRHVVRLIPLERVFFPSETELKENMEQFISNRVREFVDSGEAEACAADEQDSHDNADSCNPTKRSKAKAVAAPEIAVTAAPAAPAPNAQAGPIVSSSSSGGANESGELEAGLAFAQAIAAKLKAQSKQRHEERVAKISSSICSNGPCYTIFFKARNHNVLTKQQVNEIVAASLPSNITYNYKTEKNAVIVEALKNICGASFISHYDQLEDLNLRKFQAKHAQGSTDSGAGVGVAEGFVENRKRKVEEHSVAVENQSREQSDESGDSGDDSGDDSNDIDEQN